jgi:hypothetical protein
MNPLKAWVKESREQQRRAPGRYLASYPELVMDEKMVMMTQETLDRIERNCGRYDGTFPTGEYCGKMFLRGDYLWWFGISKEKPMTRIAWNSRKIIVVEEGRRINV